MAWFSTHGGVLASAAGHPPLAGEALTFFAAGALTGPARVFLNETLSRGACFHLAVRLCPNGEIVPAHNPFGRLFRMLSLVFCLSACGTVTGVPSHGGGKRFAVEQELISASARAALRSVNLNPLAGRSVRMVFSSIGDEGSGNLAGGRLSFDRSLQGNYSSSATTRTDIGDAFTRQILRGPAALAGLALASDGTPGYRSEAFINPRDAEFLSSLVTGHLLMAGAQVKGNQTSPADFLVIVFVDVFGTIRDRTDFLVYNTERLRARTALEVVAIRQSDGTVVLPVQRGAAEATWEEKYLFWSGPVSTTRSLKGIDDLLMPSLPPQPGYTVPPPPRVAAARKPVDPAAAPPVKRVARSGDNPRPNLLPRPDRKPRTGPPFR